MELLNDTLLSCTLFRTPGEGAKMLAALLVRANFHVEPGGELRPSALSKLAMIRTEPEETPFGVLPADSFFPRTGTDLIVLGKAYSGPGAHTMIPVSIVAGPYRMSMVVWGDRRWVRSADGAVVPSAPAQIASLPLKYEYSFGGAVEGDYGAIPFHANPLGRGFYVSEEAALDGLLPNIEDADHQVRSIEDRPEPVGTAPYPAAWSMRATRLYEYDERSGESILHPERGMYDVAHPWLSGKVLGQGDNVHISGMSPEGRSAAIHFKLPDPPCRAQVDVGYREAVVPLELEEILIDAERLDVVMSYRAMFSYDIVSEAARFCRVGRA